MSHGQSVCVQLPQGLLCDREVSRWCVLCILQGLKIVFEELIHLDSSHYGAISYHYVIPILRGN